MLPATAKSDDPRFVLTLKAAECPTDQPLVAGHANVEAARGHALDAGERS
jgi:hypothetical protein